MHEREADFNEGVGGEDAEQHSCNRGQDQQYEIDEILHTTPNSAILSFNCASESLEPGNSMAIRNQSQLAFLPAVEHCSDEFKSCIRILSEKSAFVDPVGVGN